MTLKSFTCYMTVANVYESNWYGDEPSSEQPHELWALAWTGDVLLGSESWQLDLGSRIHF